MATEEGNAQTEIPLLDSSEKANDAIVKTQMPTRP